MLSRASPPPPGNESARDRVLRTRAGGRRPRAEDLLDRHGGDPRQRGLRQRAAQQTALLALRLAAAAQDGAQQTRLLVHPAGHAGKPLCILEVLDVALLQVADVDPLLARPLLEELAELHALLGGHAREGLGGRLPVFLLRGLPGDGAVALEHLLVGVPFPRRPLLEPAEELLLVFLPLPTPQQRVEKAHDRSPFVAVGRRRRLRRAPSAARSCSSTSEPLRTICKGARSGSRAYVCRVRRYAT